MSDTSPEVERIYRDRFRRLGAEARVRMATGMFSAARTLVCAEADSRGARERSDRVLLLDRFYATDLAPEALQAARDRLATDATRRFPDDR